jgi:hypothetical protein
LFFHFVVFVGANIEQWMIVIGSGFTAGFGEKSASKEGPKAS